MKKKNVIIYVIVFISIISFISYFKYSKEKNALKTERLFQMTNLIIQILWKMSATHQKMQTEMSIS